MDTRIPQANSYETLMRVIRSLETGPVELKSLVELLNMVPRTLSYYVELGEFLGWVEKPERGALALTSLGEEVVRASPEERLRFFHSSLWGTALMTRIRVRMERAPLENAILEELIECGLAESTARRRCSAIVALVNRAGAIPSTNPDSPESIFQRVVELEDTEVAIAALTELKQRSGVSDALLQKIDTRLFELCMGR